MVHIFEILTLIMIGGATGWLTQAYVEERYTDNLP